MNKALLKLLHSNPREQEDRICFASSLSHLLLLGSTKCSLQKGHLVISYHDFVSWPLISLKCLVSFPRPRHLIPSPSHMRFTVHPLGFCTWICCVVSPFSLPYPCGFLLKTPSPSMEMAVKKKKKWRKSNIEHSLGAVCVCSSEILCYSLWEYSAHRKNHSSSSSGKGWGMRASHVQAAAVSAGYI